MRARSFFFLVSLLGFAPLAFGQQMPDPNFDPNVPRPAFTGRHPKVLFDEAHFNFHTATGRYKPFADLITRDGYRVTPNKEKFRAETLRGYDLLVIANALGAESMGSPEAANPAFTEDECAAVASWVRAGGALLLITDHAPMGAAAEIMARRFGVDMGKATTVDTDNYDKAEDNRSRIVFSRDNRLLENHAITRGRDATERVNRVTTFAGQSLKGPEGSVAFLKLGDTAFDIPLISPAERQAAIAKAKEAAGQNWTTRVLDFMPKVAVAGRAQGIAFSFGKGRVVVLGEAAMLSAQVYRQPGADPQSEPLGRMGMNLPGIDNRQLALNIMHWLSGLLD